MSKTRQRAVLKRQFAARQFDAIRYRESPLTERSDLDADKSRAYNSLLSPRKNQKKGQAKLWKPIASGHF
ncbi:hypothetical protein L596_009283 [Steinernema carpocapsae]|uniref:Uncharacterized protein n=1 Tax=Steinernema carpocapsae TaxID=34508 RepID=A0A4V6XWM1_STECR|nr:hypothetical protein L596_009283 [Steinernema carpocapsae]